MVRRSVSWTSTSRADSCRILSWLVPVAASGQSPKYCRQLQSLVTRIMSSDVGWQFLERLSHNTSNVVDALKVADEPAAANTGIRRALFVMKGGSKHLMRTILVTLSFISLSAAAALAADANAGKAVYDRACKSCHGQDGTANPAIAKMMKVEIQDLKSPEVQGMSNDDIKKVITDGKGKMRAMPSVSGADLDNVVAYVHSLKK